MIIGLIAVFKISQWALANLAYMQIYARQGCHDSRIWILHTRCENKLWTVMQQRSNCLFASYSSIPLNANAQLNLFWWPVLSMACPQYEGCYKLLEICGKIDYSFRWQHVSITVYLPHTEVLFNLTRTFFSVFVIQGFLGGNKGLSEPDSMVWILT